MAYESVVWSQSSGVALQKDCSGRSAENFAEIFLTDNPQKSL